MTIFIKYSAQCTRIVLYIPDGIYLSELLAVTGIFCIIYINGEERGRST